MGPEWVFQAYKYTVFDHFLGLALKGLRWATTEAATGGVI